MEVFVGLDGREVEEVAGFIIGEHVGIELGALVTAIDFGGFENGVMFERGSLDFTSLKGVNDGIVALAGSGGKDDFLGVAVDKVG